MRFDTHVYVGILIQFFKDLRWTNFITIGEGHPNSPARGHPSPSRSYTKQIHTQGSQPSRSHTYTPTYVAGDQLQERGGVVLRTYPTCGPATPLDQQTHMCPLTPGLLARYWHRAFPTTYSPLPPQIDSQIYYLIYYTPINLYLDLILILQLIKFSLLL